MHGGLFPLGVRGDDLHDLAILAVGGEPLGLTKLTAVALGVTSAVLLYGGSADVASRALHNTFFWFQYLDLLIL